VARAGLEPLLGEDTRGAVWVAELDTGAGRRIDGYAVVTWGWSIKSIDIPEPLAPPTILQFEDGDDGIGTVRRS
jgi:hypothetical protein